MTATLHEFPDTCAIAGSLANAATIAATESSDFSSINAKTLLTAALVQAQASDSFSILGTVSFLSSASLHTVESPDVVSIAQTQPTSGDFLMRRSGSGVVRWWDFDTDAQLGPNAVTNPSVSYLDQVGIVLASTGPNAGTARPIIDTTLKASGTGSLRVNLLPFGTAIDDSDSGGAWFGSPSDDNSIQFGPGDTFYVQVRVRWSQALYDTVFQAQSGAVQAGIKLFDIAAGNVPGGPQQYSSSNLKTVIQTYYQTRLVFIYGYGYSPATGPTTKNMFQSVGSPPTDFILQNQEPACTYTNAGSQTGPITGCFNMVPNEWTTWQIGITLLDRVTESDGFTTLNYGCLLWAARENQPSTLILNWQESTSGYFRLAASAGGFPLKFGKVWLFPYLTGQSKTQNFGADCYANYDELIISRQRIPDPVATNATLMGIGANSVLQLADFSGTGQRAFDMWAFCGLKLDPYGRRLLGFGGGHQTTIKTNVVSFSLNTLTWSDLYSSINFPDQIVANQFPTEQRWKSLAEGGTGSSRKHPVARHTYDMTQVMKDDNGKWLYMLTSGIGDPISMESYPDMSHQGATTVTSRAYLDLDTLTWTMYPGQPWYQAEGCTLDPVSNRIIIFGRAFTYDPVSPIVGSSMNIWSYNPATNVAIKSSATFPVLDNPWGNLVYFPPTDKFYFMSCSGVTPTAVQVFEITINRADPTQSTAVEVTGMTGSPPVPPDLLAETGYDCDTINGMIGGHVQNGFMYFYKPQTKVWTKRAVAIPTTHSSTTLHTCIFDPVNGVYIILLFDQPSGQTIQHTWAYRPPSGG